MDPNLPAWQIKKTLALAVNWARAPWLWHTEDPQSPSILWQLAVLVSATCQKQYLPQFIYEIFCFKHWMKRGTLIPYDDKHLMKIQNY